MNGVININKPPGISSFDVVRKVMRICNTRKVGHTGTLDPLASGVLPICIGNATKIVDYIMSDIKVYDAVLRLGITTDTYDREGKIIRETEVNLNLAEIKAVINSFIGESEQEPPMYSALKINGKRLYELARQGLVVEREKRKINIIDLDILDMDIPMVKFRVTCTKGTYIRSLCNDIGDKLGIGATMWDLVRVRTGLFKIEESINLDDLTEDNVKNNIVPIDHALASYEKVILGAKHKKLLLNGVKINNEFIIRHIPHNKICRVYTDDASFIGLGIRDEAGFKIVKLLV